MPIRINLLAEAQATEELKRRDPVKRGIWVGVFVIFLVGLWASTVMLRVVNAKSTQGARENRWETSLKKKSFDVAESRKKLADVEKRIAALSNLSTNRFLWGSFLDAMQFSVVDQIQITRIKGEERYVQLAPLPARQILGKKIPPQAAASEESITVLIEGRDYGERSYEKLKAALLVSPYLKPYLPKADMIRLQNVTQRVSGPADGGKGFNDFSLLCEFPKTARND